MNNRCGQCARYPSDISEFIQCELTPQYLDSCKAPYVLESNIKMSVEFIREVKIVENGTHLIIGKIKNVYFPKNCLKEDGYLDISKAETICSSGLDSYLEVHPIGRLSYAKPDTWPYWINVK